MLASMRTWSAVCSLDDLDREHGTPVDVDDQPVALFRLADDSVVAVHDGAPVAELAAGEVGTRDGEPTVTVPATHQVWSLATGACLDPAGHDAEPLVLHDVDVRRSVVLVASA